MTPFRRLVLSCACCLLTTATVVRADDLVPAPYRGEPLSTSALWSFPAFQPNNNIQPDGGPPLLRGDAQSALDGAFPPGSPHPSGIRFGSAAWQATPSDGGYLGGVAGTGVLAFNTPAFLATQRQATHVRLQVTYAGPPPPTDLFGFLGIPGTGTNVARLKIHRTPVASNQLPPGMSFFYEDWVILPAVDWFQVAVYTPDTTFFDAVTVESLQSFFALPGIGTVFADGFESGSTAAWSASSP